MKNPLLDKEFLLRLDESHERETLVRLIALNFNEQPIETIEGYAIGGNLNIDGKSAVRRTCNITLVTDKININDFYWGVKSKFKLEIGIKNKINKKYPDIIWFPFGVYVITSFSTSQNVNSYNISISGKDKMCLLNGEIGGAITSLSVDFGTYDITDTETGKITKKSYPIKDIIRESVHQYGNEFFHNIIINDLDELGITLKEYRGDVPLYLFKHKDSDEFLNMTLDDKIKIKVDNVEKTLSQLIQTEEYKEDAIYPSGTIRFNFDLRNSFTNVDYQPTLVTFGEKEYYIAKIEYGDTPGYMPTDLVYAGDLIANVGESITTRVLDKIVNMLGNFEYFYDVYGRFVFQKKKIYMDTAWNNIVKYDDTKYIENAAAVTPITYTFEGNKLVQSFSNNPDLMNIKNDFSIWGTKKSATGKELPVHMRYAIDNKPLIYTQFPVSEDEVKEYNKIYGTQLKPRASKECKTYITNLVEVKNEKEDIILSVNLLKKEQEEITSSVMLPYEGEKKKVRIKRKPIVCDWREIIYQMALDYRMFNHLDGFETKIIQANPEIYPLGKTGYEQYYIDMLGFWRELYNPEYEPEYKATQFIDDIVKTRFVKGYIPIDKNDQEYEKYYVLDKQDGDSKQYLSKYIDIFTLNDDDDPVYYKKIENITNEDKNNYSEIIEDIDSESFYIPVVDDSNFYKYIFYFKDNDIYKRYFDYDANIDNKETKLFIKNNNNYVLFIDYIEIGRASEEEKNDKLDFYIQNKEGNYQKIFIYFLIEEDLGNQIINKRYEQLTTIDEIENEDKDNIYYKENNNDFIKINKEKIYIKKEKDLENKILYYKTVDEKYIPYNNTISPEIKQKTLYIKENQKYIKFSDSISINREDLFVKNNTDKIISFIDKIKNVPDGLILYKENKEKNLFFRVKSYYDNRRELYIQNGKYQKKIFSPTYNFLGDRVENKKEKEILINYYEQYYDFDMDINSKNKYWNYSVQNKPETLSFWIDFLDSGENINKYSPSIIGNRPKAVNDSFVKAIYFRDVPNVLFTDKNTKDEYKHKEGYNYIQLQSSMNGLFINSSQGKSAKDVVEDNLYKHTYCTETISATVIPVYYLEPNSKIYIRDDKSGINGEYILNTLSIPLVYNGMMNISANKAVDEILY